MAESWLESEAVKLGEAEGHLVRKVAYQNRKGAPDRWFLKQGVWRLLELKDWGEEPSEQQAREHKRLLKHGARLYVCDNLEDVKRALRD